MSMAYPDFNLTPLGTARENTMCLCRIMCMYTYMMSPIRQSLSLAPHAEQN